MIYVTMDVLHMIGCLLFHIHKLIVGLINFTAPTGNQLCEARYSGLPKFIDTSYLKEIVHGTKSCCFVTYYFL